MAGAEAEVVQVGAALFRQWLRDEFDVAVEASSTDAAADTASGLALSQLSLARPSGPKMDASVAVIPVYDANADPTTLQSKAAWEERLVEVGVPPCVVWVPPLAEVPDDAGDQRVGAIAEAVAGLGQSERGEVSFPVVLRVARDGDEGSYLNAFGGLSQHWARFTNQVMGQYRLDAAALHRLPDDPEETTKLIDLIVLIANGVREVGKNADIPAQDTWVVQRVPGLDGPLVLAASPQLQPSEGRAVRKAVRAGMRGVQEAFSTQSAARPAGTPEPLKAVVFVGMFRSIEEENVAIALKGMDPMVFGSLDLACVVADGRVKRLYGPPPGSPLAG
jgi:hypothetical protein